MSPSSSSSSSSLPNAGGFLPPGGIGERIGIAPLTIAEGLSASRSSSSSPSSASVSAFVSALNGVGLGLGRKAGRGGSFPLENEGGFSSSSFSSLSLGLKAG